MAAVSAKRSMAEVSFPVLKSPANAKEKTPLLAGKYWCSQAFDMRNTTLRSRQGPLTTTWWSKIVRVRVVQSLMTLTDVSRQTERKSSSESIDLFCVGESYHWLSFHLTSWRPYWCTEQQRKSLLGIWLYYYAATFAFVLYTNMAV